MTLPTQICLGLLLVLPSLSCAASIDNAMTFSLWGGWQAIDMGDVESDLAATSNAEKNSFLYYFGGSASAEASEVESALGFGVDVGKQLSDSTGFGIRLGYVKSPTLTAKASGRGAFGETFEESWNQDASIIPLMLGVWIGGGSPQGVQFRGSLYGGVGFASAELTQSVSINVPWLPLSVDGSGKVPMSGHPLVLDIEGRGIYPVSPTVNIFVEVAYVLANVHEMVIEKDVDIDGDGTPDYEKGKHLERVNSSDPIEFNFSGMRIGGGIEFRFGGPATRVTSM